MAPLCAALLRAKHAVDAANQNKEELEALCARCKRITVQVIDKAEGSKTSKIDVKTLRKCVDKLEDLAKRYYKQSKAMHVIWSHIHGGDIQRLRTRIDDAGQDMGLEFVLDNGEKLDQILVRPPTLEFAHMPIYPSCDFPGLQVVQYHTTDPVLSLAP